MKFLICLFLVKICLVFGQETSTIRPRYSFYTDQEMGLLDICSEELGASINRTEFTQTGTISNEENRTTRCLFFCVPQKLSVTDKTGVLDSAQVKSIILTRYPRLAEKENLIRIVVKKCTRRRYSDACDRWYYLTKCIWNTYLNYITRTNLREKIANRFESKRNGTSARHLKI